MTVVFVFRCRPADTMVHLCKYSLLLGHLWHDSPIVVVNNLNISRHIKTEVTVASFIPQGELLHSSNTLVNSFLNDLLFCQIIYTASTMFLFWLYFYSGSFLQPLSCWRSTMEVILSFDWLWQATNKPTGLFIASWQRTTNEQEMVNISSSWEPTTLYPTYTTRSSSASTSTGSSTGSALAPTPQSRWPSCSVSIDGSHLWSIINLWRFCFFFLEFGFSQNTVIETAYYLKPFSTKWHFRAIGSLVWAVSLGRKCLPCYAVTPCRGKTK